MANDVRMFYLEDDIEKIQTKSNMYIRQYGPEGAFHLAREIIQNSIDECIDKESIGSEIIITYDKTHDKLVVEDDGRGFPETDYPIDIFCTKIQSGSKFFRDQGGSSSGEFGVGLTVVNALSKYFSIENNRAVENEYHIIEFEEGKKVNDVKRDIKPREKKHGCRVTFVCSQMFLGANARLPYKDMIEWLDKLSYFIPKGIKIKVDIVEDGLVIEHYKFKAQEFESLLDKIAGSKYSSKVHFKGETSDTEDTNSIVKDKNGNNKQITKKIKRNYSFEVAFRYDSIDSTEYDSYCNFTNTTDGGIHQETFDQIYCRYIIGKANDTMSENQREKLKLTWDDARTGLCAVMNLETNAQVGFVGNAKTKIDAKGLRPHISEIVQEGLEEFFKKNSNVLTEYIKIVKLNAKARIESAKIKVATQKERLNTFKEHEMTNYVRCNNTGKKFKELFLVEGRSASGSCVNARDPYTQALFLFRGVTANPMKCSIAEIMQNREWHDLVKVLRCGIGKDCDVNKLYFDRINIFTDSDTDGSMKIGLI